MKVSAIVLSAGRGTRMGGGISKQYLDIGGRPVLYYSLKAFEESFADEIILVTASGSESFCRESIVERYGFLKVKAITEGGRERYHSVFAGLSAVSSDTDYVFIHDSARPYLTSDILNRALFTVKEYGSAVAAMPVKDTIKTADGEGFVTGTVERASAYIIQTPQVFEYKAIKKAYEKLVSEEQRLLREGIRITDDAMVMELFGEKKVKLFEGSYSNLKITTPEDLEIMKLLLTGQP